MFEKRVTVRLICHYLERAGFEQYRVVPELGEKEGLVLTGWTLGNGRTHALSIDPIVEQHAVVFRAPEVVVAPPDATPEERLEAILFVISALNHDRIVGRWAFDPRSGALDFSIGVPIAGTTLGFPAFEQCLRAVIATVETDGALLGALADGTAPAQEVLEKLGLPAGGFGAHGPAEGGYL